jgi:hypothetical protein
MTKRGKAVRRGRAHATKKAAKPHVTRKPKIQSSKRAKSHGVKRGHVRKAAKRHGAKRGHVRKAGKRAAAGPIGRGHGLTRRHDPCGMLHGDDGCRKHCMRPAFHAGKHLDRAEHTW